MIALIKGYVAPAGKLWELTYTLKPIFRTTCEAQRSKTYLSKSSFAILWSDAMNFAQAVFMRRIDWLCKYLSQCWLTAKIDSCSSREICNVLRNQTGYGGRKPLTLSTVPHVCTRKYCSVAAWRFNLLLFTLATPPMKCLYGQPNKLFFFMHSCLKYIVEIWWMAARRD